MQHTKLSYKINDLTVLVAGLGYLIDMFDMFLFNMGRVKSLTDLGLSGEALTRAGLYISNWQMAGFVVGAILSGILADKFGRKVGLFGSIFIYSIGTLASAFVVDVDSYAAARFVTGLGLAGELGTGVALIMEKLNAARRGMGVMIFISLGFVGVVLAGLCVEFISWRTSYLIGGGAGLLLLLARMSLTESPLFLQLPRHAKRGALSALFKNRQPLKYYICGILLLTTGVFVPQILWTLSPEIARAMQINGMIKANIVLGIGFTCAVAGDILGSWLSEKLHSRKRATGVFLLLGIIIFAAYLIIPPRSVTGFYIFNALFGLCFGVWVITIAWVAEQFGTNIRATVTTTIPNFARAMTIPMNLAYGCLKGHGSVTAITMIGCLVFAVAVFSWLNLRETYGKDLDYV